MGLRLTGEGLGVLGTLSARSFHDGDGLSVPRNCFFVTMLFERRGSETQPHHGDDRMIGTHGLLGDEDVVSALACIARFCVPTEKMVHLRQVAEERADGARYGPKSLLP